MNNIELYENVPPLKNRFPVKVVKYTNQIRFHAHWHEHIELLYFFSGCGELTCNGKTICVSAGDFIVVNSTEIHTMTSSGGMTYLCILLYPELFDGLDFSDRIIFRNLIRNDEYIRAAVEKIMDETYSRRKGSDMAVKGMAYCLVAHLLEKYAVNELTDEEALLKEKKAKRISEVLRYISENYMSGITTAELARSSFVSEEHFCRFFRANVGKSVTEYVNEMRIDKSLVMLRETKNSITDIAFKVGFSDSNYYSRVFRKVKGITPMEFRKNSI